MDTNKNAAFRHTDSSAINNAASVRRRWEKASKSERRKTEVLVFVVGSIAAVLLVEGIVLIN